MNVIRVCVHHTLRDFLLNRSTQIYRLALTFASVVDCKSGQKSSSGFLKNWMAQKRWQSGPDLMLIVERLALWDWICKKMFLSKTLSKRSCSRVTLVKISHLVKRMISTGLYINFQNLFMLVLTLSDWVRRWISLNQFIFHLHLKKM